MAENGIGTEIAQLQQVYQVVVEFLVNYSFQIIGALIIFLLGLWVANKVATLVRKQMDSHDIDVTLTSFVSNLVRLIVIIMVAVICLGKLGISVTPMVAAIGAASLGAGLAVQGMLSNYAAGITIIVTRPFVVGNTITIKEITGQVEEIHLGVTTLTNEEGELISIPNKHIVGEILHNSFENKLVELHFNVDFQTDPQQVISLIEQVLRAFNQVDTSKPLQVGINDFSDAGFGFGVRYWVPTASYFQDKYKINLAIWNALQHAGINISTPVRTVIIVENRPKID
ncbi:mechanosensitive ion channel family protein [Shewanella avicenniae]|uniref:Small-conductance mechanosensitive channel n=1 Tax=Shewanella avicenniae TaxID=2814294 RepID=A0ABX7QPM7_9GAMM|nr:mechanosensitive ion channel family protein [Shewanella avicenniae]QSX33423.1 mechanosensitive ion channel family protein [Shewanella avicenniae]